MRILPATALAFIPYLWLAAACGPTCRDIAAAELAARARSTPTSAPHAQLTVSLAHANAVLATLARQAPRFPLEVPALGGLLPNISGFAIGVTSLEVVPARPGHIGFRIQGTLYDRNQVVLRASLAGEVRPRLDRRAGEPPSLVISPTQEMLRDLRPKFEPGAAEALGDALHRRLPGATRGLLGPQQLRGLARQALSMLESEGLQQLQDLLFPRMNKLLGLRLRLPDLPLERIRLRSQGSAPSRLTVDLFTTLPVHTGLSSAAPATDGLTLRLAGSTVAALANWAMASGQLPSQFDGSMQPQRDGPNTLLFDWRGAQPRPLKIDVFRHSAPCARICVGARAAVALKDDRIALTITERKIERVRGSALIKLKLWYGQLWSDALARTYRRAATARLEWGRRLLELRISQAALIGDELRFFLRLDHAPPPIS